MIRGDGRRIVFLGVMCALGVGAMIVLGSPEMEVPETAVIFLVGMLSLAIMMAMFWMGGLFDERDALIHDLERHVDKVRDLEDAEDLGRKVRIIYEKDGPITVEDMRNMVLYIENRCPQPHNDWVLVPDWIMERLLETVDDLEKRGGVDDGP